MNPADRTPPDEPFPDGASRLVLLDGATTGGAAPLYADLRRPLIGLAHAPLREGYAATLAALGGASAAALATALPACPYAPPEREPEVVAKPLVRPLEETPERRRADQEEFAAYLAAAEGDLARTVAHDLRVDAWKRGQWLALEQLAGRARIAEETSSSGGGRRRVLRAPAGPLARAGRALFPTWYAGRLLREVARRGRS